MATERSQAHLEHAQHAHDAAVGMGAKCSAAKAAQSRANKLLSPGALAKRDGAPNYDVVSSSARILHGAPDSVAASHLPSDGTQTSMAEIADRALVQQAHDIAVTLGAVCPDANKLAGANGIALMKLQAIRAAGGQTFGPGGRPFSA